jgi:hypothetical protein
MSPSSIHCGLVPFESTVAPCSMASAPLRSFLNPYEFGSASVAAMGSRACRDSACLALSFIVGIFTVHSPLFPTIFGIGDHHPSASSAQRPTRRHGPHPSGTRSCSPHPLARWHPPRHRHARDRLCGLPGAPPFCWGHPGARSRGAPPEGRLPRSPPWTTAPTLPGGHRLSDTPPRLTRDAGPVFHPCRVAAGRARHGASGRLRPSTRGAHPGMGQFVPRTPRACGPPPGPAGLAVCHDAGRAARQGAW